MLHYAQVLKQRRFSYKQFLIVFSLCTNGSLQKIFARFLGHAVLQSNKLHIGEFCLTNQCGARPSGCLYRRSYYIRHFVSLSTWLDVTIFPTAIPLTPPVIWHYVLSGCFSSSSDCNGILWRVQTATYPEIGVYLTIIRIINKMELLIGFVAMAFEGFMRLYDSNSTKVSSVEAQLSYTLCN